MLDRWRGFLPLLLLPLPAVILTGCSGRTQENSTAASTAKVGHAADHGAPTTMAGKPDRAEKAPQAGPSQIVIDNFAFSPATLTVKAGTKVTWVNHDDVPHTATSTAKPKAFDSGTLDTDDKYSHAFKTPGTYEYFCAVHPRMTGKVIVK
jgi:plastocyanin